MELGALWTAFRRRWYLVIVAVLVMLAATYGVMHRIGPTYSAKSLVLIFPPPEGAEPGSTATVEANPYLGLTGLNPARDVVIRTLTSAQTQASMAKRFPGAGYQMTPDPETGAPIVVIDATASSPAVATGAAEWLAAQVEPTLVSLQSSLGIEKYAYISSKLLTQDQTASAGHKSQIRAGIVVAAGTLVVSLLLIGLLDGLILSRRERRTSAGEAHPDAAASWSPERRTTLGAAPEEPPREGRQTARPRGHKTAPSATADADAEQHQRADKVLRVR